MGRDAKTRQGEGLHGRYEGMQTTDPIVRARRTREVKEY